MDAKARLSTIAETDTVQASASTLQTDRADVVTQLKTTQIAGLPIGAGLNFQSLYELVRTSAPPPTGTPEQAIRNAFIRHIQSARPILLPELAPQPVSRRLPAVFIENAAGARWIRSRW